MGRKKKSRNRKPNNSNKIPSPAAVSLSSAPAPEAPPSAVLPLSPPWVELPGDVTANILQRLGAEEMLCTAQRVCTTWWKACQDPAMWRVISLFNPERMFTEYSTMCRRAVDRSQGQLVDLTMDYFGDDELIDYIAKRSSNLKRLTLISCFDISGASLARAVKILPHLVELHLTIMNIDYAGYVEAIGIACPKLESFSFNQRGCNIQFSRDPEDDEGFEGFDWNEYALAIGKSMPNLRHLQFLANEMNNEGLEAILDGCPHLESLDIRQCFRLNLGGDLWKRCQEKIKDLKCPSDSISDVAWLAGELSNWDPYDSYESGWCSPDCDSDYYGYGDYETYDDYFSPLGYGYFDPDMAALFDPDFF